MKRSRSLLLSPFSSSSEEAEEEEEDEEEEGKEEATGSSSFKDLLMNESWLKRNCL